MLPALRSWLPRRLAARAAAVARCTGALCTGVLASGVFASGVFASGVLAAGAVPPTPAERTVSGLRLIGQQVLPAGLQVRGTTVGGLSGIDHDARRNQFILISDDRSSAPSAGPPRFYAAQLHYDLHAFTGISFTGVWPLRQSGGPHRGQPFPKLPAAGAPDPEGIRVDPVNGHLVWVSEGERNPVAQPPRLSDPFVHEMTADGQPVRSYALPAAFRVSAEDQGPRDNTAFEGLAFTPDGSHLAVIMEGALLEDGPLPTLSHGSHARLTLFDRRSAQAVRQFVVPTDVVQAAPQPAGGFSINGPTELLALSATRFLLLERSFSVGVAGNQVRLYEINTEGASNVLGRSTAQAVPVSKRLVLNFEALKAAVGGIANLEGMCFGPRLANGHDSLVVVADDNFAPAGSDTDRNQFLVFEVIP